MGNLKRLPAHKEVNDVSTEPDALGALLLPCGDHEICDTLEKKTARVTEEYVRVKTALDNEKLKLQHLTQRRTMQQALSDPSAASIERVYSTDTAGLYVYKGSRTCCLDTTSQPCTSGTAQDDTQCKHDICARATSTGISLTEMNSIKLFDMRIRYEKSDRMKGALMKQRDVELVRIKQLEDEERATFARRFNKRERNPPIERHTPKTEEVLDDEVDQQNLDTVVFESRISMMQIQKYNVFVGVRQRSQADLARCSDILSMAQVQKATPSSNSGGAEEQLRQVQIRSEIHEDDVKWCEKKLAEAAQTSNATALWQLSDRGFEFDLDDTDLYSKEFCDLVKDLLTDVGAPLEGLGDIKNAQSALARVMRQPASSRSFKVQKTLDRIKEEIYKFQAAYDKTLASNPNTAVYNPKPVSSGDLRNRIINACFRQDRITTFETGLYTKLYQIEHEAFLEMNAEYQQLLASPAKLAVSLENIKAKALVKSPLRDVTKRMLDIMISTFCDMCNGHVILEKLDELSDQVLVAKITGLVFARAEKKVEWLMEAFAAIEAMFEAVHIWPLPTRITHALQRVQTSAQARVEAVLDAAIVQEKPQVSTPTSESIVASASQTQNSGQSASLVIGTTSANVAVRQIQFLTAHEESIVDNIELYTAETAARYASYLSQRKYCPGCAILHITWLFAALLTRHPQRAGRTTTALSGGHPLRTGAAAAKTASKNSSAPEVWTHTVSCGVNCIVDMFYALMAETDNEPAPERKVSFFSEVIALVVEAVVCGTGEQSLNFESPSFSIFKAASIIEKFSADARFACAAFHNLPCSYATGGQLPGESWKPPPSVPNTEALPISEASRPEIEEVCFDNSPPLPEEDEQSDTLRTSVVPGPARHRLLPRGERYQSQEVAFEAAAKIAGMGVDLARKMSDFYVLQQKAYEQAGLTLSSETQYCIQRLRQIAYQEPNTRAQDHQDCLCPPCSANRIKATGKTSKFVEDFSDTCNEIEVTIDGRAVAEDELLGYTGATVERIRSVSSGEATLEYVCWIAHQVSKAADVAEAAGEERSLLIKRFEEFFTYYAPIPVALQLALEYTKGNIWQNPACQDLSPLDQWAILEKIVAIMGRIGANQLTFANGTDDWQITKSMMPEPLVLRKDRPARVSAAKYSAEPNSRAIASSGPHFSFGEEPQQPKTETGKEHRRTQSDQAQTETIRQAVATIVPPSSPPLAEEFSIQNRFIAYNAAAWPIMAYMGTVADDDFIPEKDLSLAIAIRVQTQHLDCVRMLQLLAESRGWQATAARMKKHLDDWGFREDDDGHYPDYWVAGGPGWCTAATDSSGSEWEDEGDEKKTT